MADERNTENFALGLIVAAILFLIFRREFQRHGAGAASAASASNGQRTEAITKQPCGCGGASSSSGPFPSNPGISIGGQSYSPGASSFPQTSVKSRGPLIAFAEGGPEISTEVLGG